MPLEEIYKNPAPDLVSCEKLMYTNISLGYLVKSVNILGDKQVWIRTIITGFELYFKDKKINYSKFIEPKNCSNFCMIYVWRTKAKKMDRKITQNFFYECSWKQSMFI